MDTLKGNFDARFNTLLSHFMMFLLFSTYYSWHQLWQTFFLSVINQTNCNASRVAVLLMISLPNLDPKWQYFPLYQLKLTLNFSPQKRTMQFWKKVVQHFKVMRSYRGKTWIKTRIGTRQNKLDKKREIIKMMHNFYACKMKEIITIDTFKFFTEIRKSNLQIIKL